jgi:hypothetical protein
MNSQLKWIAATIAAVTMASPSMAYSGHGGGGGGGHFSGGGGGHFSGGGHMSGGFHAPSFSGGHSFAGARSFAPSMARPTYRAPMPAPRSLNAYHSAPPARPMSTYGRPTTPYARPSSAFASSVSTWHGSGGYGGVSTWHGGQGWHGYPWHGWHGGYGWYGWHYGGLRPWFWPGWGVYVAALPVYYTTLWWGGIPYYYANNGYYTWDPSVAAYQEVPPPAGLDTATQPSDAPPPADAPAQAPAAAAPSAGSDLYVYPNNGQPAEQVASDRAQCRQWASQQADPSASGGQAYLRAESACLEGRGYTVR